MTTTTAIIVRVVVVVNILIITDIATTTFHYNARCEVTVFQKEKKNTTIVARGYIISHTSIMVMAFQDIVNIGMLGKI